MKIESKLLTPNKYSRPQTKMSKIEKIVIHWVGNANSSAIANRNYFDSLKDGKLDRYASSHYIIGLDGEIIQCVPENEIAYHAKQANSYAIGIEVCHQDWNGKFNDKTISSIVWLCNDICNKYNLNPKKDIIRHFDVTKKSCPEYYVKHADEWYQLINKIAKSNNDLELINAVDKLVKHNIISTPQSWYSMETMKPQYYEAIITNYLRIVNKKVGCNLDCKIVLLYRLRIIKDIVSWLDNITPKMMRSLIIKMAGGLE